MNCRGSNQWCDPLQLTMYYHHGDQFDLMCVILYVVTRCQADLVWKIKTGIVQRCVALAQLHNKTPNLHYLCIWYIYLLELVVQCYLIKISWIQHMLVNFENRYTWKCTSSVLQQNKIAEKVLLFVLNFHRSVKCVPRQQQFHVLSAM